MVWLLASTVLTVIHVVSSFESIEHLWDVETVYNNRHLPENTGPNVSVSSKIECMITALTVKASMATYDTSSQWCILHDTVKQTNKTNVLYVIGIAQGEHDNIKGNSTQNSDIKTCGDLDSDNGSGVYRITPVPDKSFDVYCDMDSEGGPWTVIQNRENNEVDFYRDWDQYKTGFGDQHGNYWLGNDGIFALTKTPCVLRIQLESVNETFGYAEYTEFQISDEAENYTLSVSGFRGNISNAFEENNGQLFSTAERDNDAHFKNCAVIRKAPWWHRRCTAVNLNGEYNVDHWRTSMYWKGFYEEDVPTRMKKTRMMLKKP